LQSVGRPLVTVARLVSHPMFSACFCALPSRPNWRNHGLMEREQKITFRAMRDTGVRGILIYCADYKCSHSTAISGDHWGDEIRLSDIEPLFTCKACGKRGADVRPDFNWNKQQPVAAMGYR
jgi:hypothetical protein